MPKKYCECGEEIWKESDACRKCSKRPSKIDWPSNAEMQDLLWSHSRLQLSKMLNVSDNAIRKHAKKNNLIIPDSQYIRYLFLGRTDECNRIRLELIKDKNGGNGGI